MCVCVRGKDAGCLSKAKVRHRKRMFEQKVAAPFDWQEFVPNSEIMTAS